MSGSKKSKKRSKSGKTASRQQSRSPAGAPKTESQSRKYSTKSKSRKQSQKIPWQWVTIGAIAIVLILAGVYFIQSQGQAQTAQEQTPTQVAASFPDEISIDEAYAKYQAGTFLLDVRTPEEWADYHVPNTTLIPLDELPDRLNELPSDQEIVVVCRSGNRSQEGRDILRQAGFTQVTSMSGGLKQWRDAGYPIESGS
jgi:rhodanese-related sulfurtransferase